MKRAEYPKVSPVITEALFALSKSFHDSPVGKELFALVDMRASQLNGCLFCLDMHAKQARLYGDRELRLHHLAVWRESSLFTPREKAALEYTERMTRMDGHPFTDAEYGKLAEHFSEREIADLALRVGTINLWNRLGVTFQPIPGALDHAYGLDRAGLE